MKLETNNVNKNDASSLKKKDFTTPNKVEKNFKLKKNDLAGSKTPLPKTTINLKADNTDLEKTNNDKMYRTLKNNNKDPKNVSNFNN